MLELKNITKIYPAGGEDVHALKGIDLQFRPSEFVAILGPSGCGKTTTLNIIGGLDQYTSGDLVINGRSTRDFRDRDWDAYRNHSIGFVFQSYNLIAHQSVLRNVELALTLSGVGKKERRARAVAALEAVGLGSQMKKRPAEMSGGQMQRVAIARAIVNDPDIILADEPTGALDTETSVQVMDILKEISRDRLVIMVTHNPELAARYATRTVRMLDGQIVGDSAPLSAEELAAARQADADAQTEKRREKLPSMRLATSFGLSLNNLFTKKGRTILTAFAGSIGIIGIALIFAVSRGTTNYIDEVQEQTLSSYPLTLQQQNIDMSSLMTTFMSTAGSESEHDDDALYQKTMIYDMVNAMSEMDADVNDLGAFRSYLDERLDDPEDPLSEAVSGVQYGYDLDMLFYTEDDDGNILRSDAMSVMNAHFGDMWGMSEEATSNPLSSLMMQSESSYATWQQMLSGRDGELISPVVQKQYELVYGRWPSAWDEVVLVMDESNELYDIYLYALGLLPASELDEIARAALNLESVETQTESWSYEDVCAREFKLILPADCYSLDEQTGLYTDLRETEAGLRYLYRSAEDIHIVGIIRPDENAVGGMLTGAVAYTAALTEHVIDSTAGSESLKAQEASPDIDIFTGLPFADTDGEQSDVEKAAAFDRYAEGLDTAGKAALYVQIESTPDEETVAASAEPMMAELDREGMEDMLISALTEQTGMDEDRARSYIADMDDDELSDYVRQGIDAQIEAQYAASAEMALADTDETALAEALDALLPELDESRCAALYDACVSFSASSYEDNLLTLGGVDPEVPYSISLYAASFADKDAIEDAIADYNAGVDELHQINYTDYVGLIMSSVTTIINAITYVLIAFVAISLIVSSIMIGVITLISVQERTKEIGILRAIGASKRNVSTMFNAETVIIGLASGLLGVGVTWLLCIPINLILHHLTGIGNLSATLPPAVAAILVAISVLLTLFAGIIPSRSAAKKDPVEALRSE